MKRVHIIVDGYVQKVGFREFVLKETFGRGITGYVKNLDTGKVAIIAEGSEDELRALIPRINITRYPVSVTECNVSWEEATGEFRKFEIFRGDMQEEIFERIDYAGTIMHENLDVSKETLSVSKETLDVSKETLSVSKETLSISKETLKNTGTIVDLQKSTLDMRG
ncbi:MAG: acylphosphatase [Methanomicrobium sp.]|nr:acylphosphatase [Methanomicrobium sp.]